MSTFTLIAAIRNEAPYLLEWLAHHLAVGADEFVLCVYGSSDGTAKLTRRLAAMGYAAHVKIAVEDGDPNRSALAQVADLEEVRNADWVSLMQVDQFLNIHLGQGGIDDLISHSGTADVIDLPVLPFGCKEASGDQGQRITQRFTKRADRPLEVGSVRIARRLPLLSSTEPRSSVSAEHAQINQYRCKSLDHLATRLATPFQRTPVEILKSWAANNRVDVADLSIQKYEGWTTKYEQFLISDRRLRLAQDAGVNWHQTQAERAQNSPELRELLDKAET